MVSFFDMKSNFHFASATCGFKKTHKPDLAVIYSHIPCNYAGVFTTNQVRAACVDENKKVLLRKKKIRAVVINSGNANACTGKNGIQAVSRTKKIAARLLRIKPDEVLVASTGIIGVPLDVEKIENGLKFAASRIHRKNFKEAASAILTTDRFKKTVNYKTKGFNLTGFAKGAGMIHPNMATMLCFLMTDLKMPQNLLQNALKNAADDTFNTISVDGDMSTNDMVILLSNNQSNKEVKSKNDPLYLSFLEMLNKACYKIAKEIVRDGEGAKKIISVEVNNAKTNKDAKEIARSISTSCLFKCAVFGSDPNWGRAAARIGWTGVKVDQRKIDIFFNNTQVMKRGNPVLFDKTKLNKEFKKKDEIKVTVNLNIGKKSGMALGCDLTYDYVRLNSAYST